MDDHDRLHLLNTKTVAQIRAMSDDEIWDFLMERFEQIAEWGADREPTRRSFVTRIFYAAPYGIDHFRKHFLRDMEDYREGMIFSLTMDFGFEGEQIYLDYYGTSGLYDDEVSCSVGDYYSVMPWVDEDSEDAYYKENFALLESPHLEVIIRALETHEAALTKNTRDDINKIIAMKEACEQHEHYKVAYIYY